MLGVMIDEYMVILRDQVAQEVQSRRVDGDGWFCSSAHASLMLLTFLAPHWAPFVAGRKLNSVMIMIVILY